MKAKEILPASMSSIFCLCYWKYLFPKAWSFISVMASNFRSVFQTPYLPSCRFPDKNLRVHIVYPGSCGSTLSLPKYVPKWVPADRSGHKVFGVALR